MHRRQWSRTLTQNPQFIQHAATKYCWLGWNGSSNFLIILPKKGTKCSQVSYMVSFSIQIINYAYMGMGMGMVVLCWVCMRVPVQWAQHSVVHIIEISIWGINRVSISPPPYRRHLCEFVHFLTVHGDLVRPSLFINDGCVLYYAITRKCISKHESHSH